MTEIRHIVFDIGKVLVHYDPDLPFSRLIPDEAERKWFFDNVCTSAWNIEQDRGRTWEEAEAEMHCRCIPTMRKTSATSAATGTRWCRMPMTTASR